MANLEIPSDKRDFRCVHCNGKILIPRDLPPTTGPCPHCTGVITSPALEAAAPLTFQTPSPPPPAALSRVPVEPAPPEPPQPAPVQPAPRSTPPPPPQDNTPAPVPAPLPAKTSSIPASRNPKVAIDTPHAGDPPASAKQKTPTPPAKAEPPKKSALIPVMLVLLLLILGGGAAVIFVAREMGNHIAPPSLAPPGGDPAAKEAKYIRVGWQKDAYQLLRGYVEATTSEEKLPYILNGDALSSRLEDFYGGSAINDSDTPADAFSIYELSEDDRKRGLFMMVYDQPPQFEMKEFFRPLASLEVQYGIDEADLLLSTLARVGNFAMEPLRVHAFFKRTPEGLKLDWEIFAQTKYRTFQNFTELPETGQIAVFRVFIVEDVPDKGRLEAGTRTYRVADPANTTDTARVNVRVDSEIGRTLSIINWRGVKDARPITRTATVELKWTGEPSAPELEINRFICWEFLGLGGQDSTPTASTK